MDWNEIFDLILRVLGLIGVWFVVAFLIAAARGGHEAIPRMPPLHERDIFRPENELTPEWPRTEWPSVQWPRASKKWASESESTTGR